MWESMQTAAHVETAANATLASKIAAAVRLRPRPLPSLLIAGAAAALDLVRHPERAHLSSLLLALRPVLPAGWRAPAGPEEQPGAPVTAQGPTSKAQGYRCDLSGRSGLDHPLRQEMSAALADADDVARDLLARKDKEAGVHWDDADYETDGSE